MLTRVTFEAVAQAEGMSRAFLQRMLRGNNPHVVLTHTLMIIAQMARRGKAAAGNEQSATYDLIHKADIYSALRKLLHHADGVVRMRVCNLVGARVVHSHRSNSAQRRCGRRGCSQRGVGLAWWRPHAAHTAPPAHAHAGNLFRHDSFFYDKMDRQGFIPLLVERLTDPDESVRKYACFALGNAAFHNASLYPKLSAGIGPLVALLSERDTKTRLNAAGALGNMARNGTGLVAAMLQADAVTVRAWSCCTRHSSHCR